MANVMVPFPGAGAQDVASLVTSPLEQVLGGIDGVKHVYSVSQPGVAVLPGEYQVGVKRQTALVRLYNQVLQNRHLWPPRLGLGVPVDRAKGRDAARVR